MATLAGGKVVTTKCSLAVVTRHAAGRAPRRVMVQRLGSRYTISRQSSAHLMTIIASQAFVPIVFLVTESDFESRRHLADARRAT